MGKIKIESGIAMPSGSPLNKYPWPDMKVGDSFLVPTNIRLDSFQQQMYYAGKKLGFKFSCKKHEGGRRCWRIA